MPTDTMVLAKELAEILYSKIIKEPDHECRELLWEWTKEVFYGKLVKDYLPIFDYVWKELISKGYKSRKKSFDYGDYDVSTWSELVGKKQIVIYIRHCSMADDNTFIFIKDDSIPDIPKYMDFKIVTVWPRQFGYPRKWGSEWKGRVKLPSLNTYRKKRFSYGYGDARDKGAVLKYEALTERVENAHWTEPRILRALDILREIKNALDYPD